MNTHTMSDEDMIEFRARTQDELGWDITDDDVDQLRRYYLLGMTPDEAADALCGLTPERFTYVY